jgi:hypothetical protein
MKYCQKSNSIKSQHVKGTIFLYINNEYAKKEIKKIIFSQVSQKYLGINLTKEVNNPCNGDNKTSKKETEDTRR